MSMQEPPIPLTSSEPVPIIYYGKFDAQGATQGFWNTDIYPPQENGDRNAKIPPEAVEITEAQWKELCNNPLARYTNGTITYVDPPPLPPPPEPIVRCWSDQYKAFANSQTGVTAVGLIAWDRANPSSAFHVYIAKVNTANTDITSVFLPAMVVGAVLRFEDRRNPTTRYVTHKIKTAPVVRTDDIAIEITQDTATAMPFFDGQLLNFIVYPPT